MANIIGLKELRENVGQYAQQVAKGKSFIVVRQSKPLFKISPIDEEENWETVIDFTKIKKGGVPVGDIVAAIGHERNRKSSREASQRI
jgi:antitoxin (DNA-binding transcriptional repressor) of toxin-antitoxin stability system